MAFKKLTKTIVACAVLASLVPAASVNAAPIQADQAKVAAKASDRILVKAKAGKDIAAIASKHGATLKAANSKSQWKVLNVPAGKADLFLNKLLNDADVEAAEYDYLVEATLTPNDPSYPSQYHLPKIQADLAWNIVTGTPSRTIAVIDTGVDLQHPDLAGKFVAGYDFVNNDADPDDDHGHGTHVAGIAAAVTNNSLNVAGVDWNAKVMPIKVLNAAGSGYTSDIIEGVYYAADNGAHVINMSLGGGAFSQAFQDAINYAWNKGLIIVAAAGNSSTSVKSYPAAYSNVVAVASTTSTDALSSFSNYGSWVDIAAPGSSILSLKNGGGTTTMSGTSMASPVVAGVASLTWSKNMAATNAGVVNRLFSTADPISGTGTYFTYGRVNAYKAVNGF
jgi:thermitase